MGNAISNVALTVFLEDDKERGPTLPFLITIGDHHIWIALADDSGKNLASLSIDYFDGRLCAVVYPFDAESGEEVKEGIAMDLVNDTPSLPL